MRYKYIHILGLLLIMQGLFSCSTTRYLSQPVTPDFIIDGERLEWDGRFETPDKEKYAIAVGHDSNYLFLAFVSMDPSFKRSVIGGGGFTIWLDVKGGKREDLGLIFKPSQLRQVKVSQHANRINMDGAGARGMPPIPRMDMEMELIVTRAGGERLGPADLLARASAFDEEIFFEIQVPRTLVGALHKNGELGIGLESATKAVRPASHSRGGSGISGMQGGRQGGRSGGRGARPGMAASQKFNSWVIVELIKD